MLFIWWTFTDWREQMYLDGVFSKGFTQQELEQIYCIYLLKELSRWKGGLLFLTHGFIKTHKRCGGWGNVLSPVPRKAARLVCSKGNSCPSLPIFRISKIIHSNSIKFWFAKSGAHSNFIIRRRIIPSGCGYSRVWNTAVSVQGISAWKTVANTQAIIPYIKHLVKPFCIIFKIGVCYGRISSTEFSSASG